VCGEDGVGDGGLVGGERGGVEGDEGIRINYTSVLEEGVRGG